MGAGKVLQQGKQISEAEKSIIEDETISELTRKELLSQVRGIPRVGGGGGNPLGANIGGGGINLQSRGSQISQASTRLAEAREGTSTLFRGRQFFEGLRKQRARTPGAQQTILTQR